MSTQTQSIQRIGRKLALLAGVAATALGFGAVSAQAAEHTASGEPVAVFGSQWASLEVVDGDTLKLNGSGFASEAPVFVGQCETEWPSPTSCNAETAIETNADAGGNVNETIELVDEFESWNPHDPEEEPSGTVTCAENCRVYVAQHSGMFPFGYVALSF